MSTNEPAPARLLADDRGAIMVMGIFMCSCLVGALWYLAGMGDAILYRERMQEAADAVAFSDAALHARGMNLIVLINLVMAVILSVRVALRVGKLVTVLAAATFAALGFINPPLWAASPPTGGAAVALESVDRTTTPVIDGALHALVAAQKAISAVTPAASHFAATSSVGKRYEIVTDTAAIEPDLQGLPTETRNPGKLCGEAAEVIPKMVDWLFSKVKLDVLLAPLSPALKMLRELMEDFAKAGSGTFCGLDGGGSSTPDQESKLDEAARGRCNDIDELVQKEVDHFFEAENAWLKMCADSGVTCTSRDAQGQVLPAGVQTGVAPPSPPPNVRARQNELDRQRLDRDQAARSVKGLLPQAGDFKLNRKKCIAWAKDDLRQRRDEHEALGLQQQTVSTTSSSSSGIAPMLIKDFTNGSARGQFLAGVKGDASRLEPSARFVRVAAVGDKRVSAVTTPEPATIPSWAQAEIYYDCDGRWNDKQCNADDEAMWHFMWRARLRRFDQPANSTVAKLAGMMHSPPPRRDHSQFADALGAAAITPSTSGPRANAALRKELAKSLQDPTTRTQGVH